MSVSIPNQVDISRYVLRSSTRVQKKRVVGYWGLGSQCGCACSPFRSLRDLPPPPPTPHSPHSSLYSAPSAHQQTQHPSTALFFHSGCDQLQTTASVLLLGCCSVWYDLSQVFLFSFLRRTRPVCVLLEVCRTLHLQQQQSVV